MMVSVLAPAAKRPKDRTGAGKLRGQMVGSALVSLAYLLMTGYATRIARIAGSICIVHCLLR